MHATLFGVGAALRAAMCQTATDIGTKVATREAEERLTLAVQWTVGAVLLSFLCLVWYPTLLLQPAATFAALTRPGFWPLLLLDGVLNVIAYYLFVRAFRLSDASLVAPLILITPVLLLVTSPLILGEHVPPLGALGVIFAVLGSAFLGGSSRSVSLRTSFIVCARDHGVRSMFVTAVIWSITSNLDKLGVRASTPLLWAATLTTFIALCSIIFWLAMPHRPLRLRDYALRGAFRHGQCRRQRAANVRAHTALRTLCHRDQTHERALYCHRQWRHPQGEYRWEARRYGYYAYG